MSSPIVEFQNVQKTFLHNGVVTRAIDNVSFAVHQGDFVGYAGPNGAGKSTSIKAMTGLLSVTSGSVRVCGVDPLAKRRALAQHIGVVFGQRTQLFMELSPADCFEVIRALYRVSRNDGATRVAGLSMRLGITEIMDQPVRTLSLGQRMRCELVAALLPRPDILFLDEPTIGLDLEAKDAIRAVLREANARYGTTVMLTTHDLPDIEALCSRLLVIDKGQLAYDGKLDALAKEFSQDVTIAFRLTEGGVIAPLPHWKVARDGEFTTVTFAHGVDTTANVIRRVLDNADVIDLQVREPSIEDVLRSLACYGVPTTKLVNH